MSVTEQEKPADFSWVGSAHLEWSWQCWNCEEWLVRRVADQPVVVCESCNQRLDKFDLLNDQLDVVQLTSAEVVEALGVTPRQLDYWDTTKLVVPSLASATGTGSTRLYSGRDLFAIEVAALLSHLGINLKKHRHVLLMAKSLPAPAQVLAFNARRCAIIPSESAKLWAESYSASTLIRLDPIIEKVERYVERSLGLPTEGEK